METNSKNNSASRDNIRCWKLDKVSDDVSPFSIVPGLGNVTNMTMTNGLMFSSSGDRGWGGGQDSQSSHALFFYEERAW